MKFSLLQPLSDIPLAFVDVETTGASAGLGDRVTEVGVVRIEGGRVVAEYQQLVDPKRRISPGVQALTGITQAMVDGQPTFADQIGAVVEHMQGAAVIGHNVSFDLSFLASEFRRAGTQLHDALGDVPVLDTVRMARRRFGRGGNGLQVLSRRLGITPTVAHRALADAQTTAGVFAHLIGMAGSWNLPLCDAFVMQGGATTLKPVTVPVPSLPLELEEALEQQKLVRLEYLDARQRRTQRVIQPIEVRTFKGELTLVAHCQLRNDRRTFKVDRIVQILRADIETAHGTAPRSNETGHESRADTSL